ncbi:MAG: T9SS type A sorting domain-containing protein [Bacteroidota bacterium]
MIKTYRRILFIVISLIIAETAYSQTPNDECSAAFTITALPFQHLQDTRLASPNITDPAQTCQDSLTSGKTVWFKYSADTSRFIVFSTIGSGPIEDYDITMSVFTGACGSLTEINCNDDTLDTRQSAIGLFAVKGTTYFIMVGEWGGGGPNGGVPTGGDLKFTVTAPELPPLVRGPKSGMINNGVITNTDNFISVSEIAVKRQNGEKRNENERVEKLPPPKNMTAALAPYGSNYVEDRSSRSITSAISRPVAVQDFEGVPQTNFIPPDPILAVGPNHVMVAVNSTFRIFDKNGTILKTIDADAWFNQVIPGASTFDPIVMYDHFAQRWIFVMLHVDDANSKSYILLGVSDDNNPLGLWYNWATPAHVLGDSTVSNWTDYARVGFDKDALYITGNQFGFTSGFAYSKVRIIPKAQLYENNAHAITWKDFWDFRDPDDLQTVIFGLRPSISFGNSGKQLLLNDSPYFLGTFFTLWSIDSVLTHPTVTGKNIPVVQYFPSPDADQKDGGSLPIEAFGADIRNEPIYRDSALWAVHAVASGPNKEFSAVRYVKIDPFQQKTLEDVSFGLDGYWHSYPALMVNKNGDMTITYSRSGNNEYIGAFVTGRKKNDAPGLAPSIALRDGRGNYVVDFASGRNRWGDYSGIGLDPSDEMSVWTHTEFAAAKNSWGTWIAKTVMGPVPGSKLTRDRSFVNFGTKNVGTSSDTITITLTNDGIDTLILSSLSTRTNNFILVGPPVLPLRIPSLGSYQLRIVFAPKTAGALTDSIMYCAAQSCVTTNTLTALSGTGFLIVPAELGTIYAASGTTDGGKLYSVNSSNGIPTYLLTTGLGLAASLRVHPTTKQLIALDAMGGNGGTIYRISTSGTSVQKLSDIAIQNAKGMTFLNDSIAYIADFNGRIYRVNIYSGSMTQIGNTGLRISGLAMNPVNGTLWFCLRATSGTLDGLYQFDRTSSTVKLIGQTGTGVANSDLMFDKNGKLYVLSGINSSQNKLLTIDTTTGKAVKELSLNRVNMLCIALNPDAVADVQTLATVAPSVFSLEQNYPNPFNPLTVVQYSIPIKTAVHLKVYDELGREVQTLVDGIRNPGVHKEFFDATGLSSGLYFYRISAGEYVFTRKMLVIK